MQMRDLKVGEEYEWAGRQVTCVKKGVVMTTMWSRKERKSGVVIRDAAGTERTVESREIRRTWAEAAPGHARKEECRSLAAHADALLGDTGRARSLFFESASQQEFELRVDVAGLRRIIAALERDGRAPSGSTGSALSSLVS